MTTIPKEGARANELAVRPSRVALHAGRLIVEKFRGEFTELKAENTR